ncbi:MAG: hypothetical protein AAF208_02020 [Cyanobacteria bacterium P01_A01_bin.45]
MIISDLNYLETSTEEVLGGNFNFKKNIASNVKTDVEFDFDSEFDKDVDIDANIDAKANVQGNITNVLFDVEAVGKDTFVEAEVSVLSVENELSSAAGSFTSVVN